MESEYGPLAEHVKALVAMTDMLTEDRVVRIADAYRAAGLPHIQFARVAAKRMDRHTEATAAMRDVSVGVNIFAMLNDSDRRDLTFVTWAAKNVGYAAATEDLIGVLGYSIHEYARLTDPWYAGFRDVPMEMREGAG